MGGFLILPKHFGGITEFLKSLGKSREKNCKSRNLIFQSLSRASNLAGHSTILI